MGFRDQDSFRGPKLPLRDGRLQAVGEKGC